MYGFRDENVIKMVASSKLVIKRIENRQMVWDCPNGIPYWYCAESGNLLLYISCNANVSLRLLAFSRWQPYISARSQSGEMI